MPSVLNYLLPLTCITLVPFASASGYADSIFRCEGSLKIIHESELQSTEFANTETGFGYLQHLGDRFMDDVAVLPYESHFVDSGSRHALALLQLASGVETKSRRVQIQSRGLTSIDLRMPSDSPFISLLSNMSGRQYRYLQGKPIEQYSAIEIGIVDLLTDINGPFSYTNRIDLVLRKYLEILKVGGKAYIAFESRYTSVNNTPWGLGEYLERIRGAKIEWLKGGSVVRIEKTDFFAHQNVPELKLKEFFEAIPPRRFYEWAGYQP